ncbi:flavin-dependent oxidoreductase [Reyranella sp.]|jgi:2-polyprenyl-6-methoxyphenol hydroxylase-like FAD-dependent oxidoreductase|uniref:flavin-dependent oxidoreductase n=1 Tax=Reyranella sp. TaxID=1929291 RepID=UPI000BC960C1|nr:flavin-dependent oxidoreductase [Reyranella sp.]OYY45240.1 MAG: flavin-dependent oxidoreductase [Rhodospirillales bacterium 35-66-84]OYZ95706.1 MAG: flavin-dependent oxidoreductase [Rhodospirillales bacterium 24-66-33]OZB27224.1 MAG: flavin-dependent oxidoreductase [Rhodospirillales bacterium 39-66-50]HQS18830.1 flavin-dependent oxidoreductase [Reyranella sp.]HQT12743.1 flavin-dependent oxidoreductase [Reyranella sp.]
MKIIIAGAGIGGLTAAMCLHRAGHDVTVYEAVSEMRPLGVGINIQAGAVRILCGLGLEPALAATAIETRELRYANRHGQTIWADPRGRHAGLPWPQFSIHRGELQMILVHAAREMLGADRIRMGRRIADFAQHGATVTARFADRDGAIVEEATADLLIAADGIHSAVRARYYPNEGPPKWQGILMWRGVTVGKPYLGGNTMVQAGHHNQKFVCYPISRAHAERGEALINWICDLHMGDGALPSREDWNKRGRLEDFLPRFADWNFGWLDVPDVIRNAHTILEFPMVDRDPLPRWSHGRITLLGDAAHPMYPIGSNGASQAILDGEAITQELAVGDDPEVALRRYEERRLPPTARIVESNRRKGIDVMLDIVEQRAPQGFTDLESVLPSDELEKIVGDYKKLVTQDRETLLKLAAASM